MNTQPEDTSLTLVPDHDGSEPETLHDVEGAPEPAGPVTPSPAVARSRPTRTLPTPRISFPKQLEILRAWAIAAPNGKPATNQQVAEIVGLRADTVTLANTFFADTKLLQRADGGYVPSDVTLAYHQACEWTPETAAHKLAPALREAWFGNALLPTLQLRSLGDTEAMAKLASEAGASKEHRPQLVMILDYLEAGGLVVREAGQIRISNPTGSVSPPTELPPERSAEPPQAAQRDAAPSKAPTVSTGFAATPEGQLQFNINFRVTMSEIAGWPADRITAFFAGVAQVLAAKADVEKGANSN